MSIVAPHVDEHKTVASGDSDAADTSGGHATHRLETVGIVQTYGMEGVLR